jgi:hypothetical protein
MAARSNVYSARKIDGALGGQIRHPGWVRAELGGPKRGWAFSLSVILERRFRPPNKTLVATRSASEKERNLVLRDGLEERDIKTGRD